jgi:hypothetical protein
MNDLRTAAQQALEALERNVQHKYPLETTKAIQLGQEAITALRAALEQPEQEPVAWTDRELQLIDGMIEVQLHHAAQCDGIANRTMAEKQKGWDMERVALLQKIKSNPPRREWVSLTDEEMHGLYRRAGLEAYYPRDGAVQYEYERRFDAYARAIEQACKERNT